uniref:Reverse transcriptase domain-containing protein n=1 Tax=Xenopus tropicalis TaxID=8364 RepID=A0A803JHB8_XENTR
MIVVLDSDTYKNEALRQLTDTSTYQVLKGNPTVSYSVALAELVGEAFANGLISEKIRDYLIPRNPRIPLFHHLPKVHKKERPPVGRPIVSGIASLNEKLSEYVDLYLQPLVQRLTSYVRDTKHVLQMLSNFTWQDTYSWGTVDVTSLYSCIPHDKGLQAIAYHLETYSTYDTFTKDFILDSITYLLSHNFFKFDGTFYLQKCGTSMGAKFAPTYANLYMGWWEETHIYGGTHDLLSNIVFYKRYVDDLLLIWQGSEFDFDNLVSFFNHNVLNLHFTSDFNIAHISFLDLKLTGSDCKVETTVFRKACSGNSLLRADSCHPNHMFRGIPLGQFYRIRRNCSTLESFVEQACLLRDRFLDRGYTMRSLSAAFTKALNTNRLELLKDNTMKVGKNFDMAVLDNKFGNINSSRDKHAYFKNTNNRNKNRKNRNSKCIKEGDASTGYSDNKLPTFVTAYSNQFYKIREIFYNLLPVLYNDPLLETTVSGGCKVVARRAPTLGNLLSPTLWRSCPTRATWLTTKGTYPCGAKRCVTCKHIKRSTVFYSSLTGKSYSMRVYANCNTQHVVYLLTCSCCNIQYVGCTIRPLKK